MAKLTVSLAGVDYDRTRAIFDGTVGIEGCETICCAMPPEEAFHRAFRYQEFDIALIGFRGGEVGTGSRSKRGLVRGRERG